MVWKSSHAGIIMSKPLSAATLHDNDLTSSTDTAAITKRLYFFLTLHSPNDAQMSRVPVALPVRPSSQFRYAETRHERSAYYIQYNRVRLCALQSQLQSIGPHFPVRRRGSAPSRTSSLGRRNGGHIMPVPHSVRFRHLSVPSLPLGHVVAPKFRTRTRRFGHLLSFISRSDLLGTHSEPTGTTTSQLGCQLRVLLGDLDLCSGRLSI